MGNDAYPWFHLVSGDGLQQGDILESCPVFSPPSDLAHDFDSVGRPEPEFDYEHRNVVVMSQSCDLATKKAEEVLLCSIWSRDDYQEGQEFAKPAKWEEVRKGRLPAYHVLSACRLEGFERPARIVDFKHVYTLPLAFLRARASKCPQRVRLMPPYREHLAQAFARFFMRIGLPVDIPKFE